MNTYMNAIPHPLGELTPEQIFDENDTILDNIDAIANLLDSIRKNAQDLADFDERISGNKDVFFADIISLLELSSQFAKQITATEPVVKLYE